MNASPGLNWGSCSAWSWWCDSRYSDAPPHTRSMSNTSRGTSPSWINLWEHFQGVWSVTQSLNTSMSSELTRSTLVPRITSALSNWSLKFWLYAYFLLPISDADLPKPSVALRSTYGVYWSEVRVAITCFGCPRPVGSLVNGLAFDGATH